MNTLDTVEPGALVILPSGPVGVVKDQRRDNSDDSVAGFTVTLSDSGADVVIPLDACDVQRSTETRLYLLPEAEALLGISGDALGSSPERQSVTVPLAAEELETTVRQAEVGRLRVRKRVETEPVERMIDLGRDEVLVERREVNQTTDEIVDPWYDGDTLVVPVYEEVLVTEKRLMLREEVRILRRPTTEQVLIQDTLRREVLEMDEEGYEPGNARDERDA